MERPFGGAYTEGADVRTKEFLRQLGRTIHFMALLWAVIALGLVIQFGSRLTVRVNYMDAVVSYAEPQDEVQFPTKAVRK